MATENPSAGPTIGVLALQGGVTEHLSMLKKLNISGVEVKTKEQLANVDGLIMPGGESTTIALLAERNQLVVPLKSWVHANKPTFGTCAGLILMAEAATGTKKGGQTLLGGLDVTVDRNHYGRQIASFESQLKAPALGTEPIRAVFIRAPGITRVGQGVEVLANLPPEDNPTTNTNAGDRETVNASGTDAKAAAGSAGTATVTLAGASEAKAASAATTTNTTAGPKPDSATGISATGERAAAAAKSPAAGLPALHPVAVRQGSLLATTFHPELTEDTRWHQLFVDIVRRSRASAGTSAVVTSTGGGGGSDKPGMTSGAR